MPPWAGRCIEAGLALALLGRAALAAEPPPVGAGVCLIQQPVGRDLARAALAQGTGGIVPKAGNATPAPAPAAEEAKAPSKVELPNEALHLELRLPVELHTLQSGPLGPASHFLRMLKEQLSAAAGLPARRLVPLSIRGEYTGLRLAALQREFALPFHVPREASLAAAGRRAEAKHGAAAAPLDKAAAATKATHPETEMRLETIIDLEVLPATLKEEKTVQEVFEKLLAQLADEDGDLMQGPLGSALQGATLLRGPPPLRSSSGALPGPTAGAWALVALGAGWLRAA